MAHYFDASQKNVKSNKRLITFDFQTHTFKFYTDHGVFSKGKIDTASHILLQAIQVEDKTTSVLDLGCGYGLFGIVLAKQHNINVDMMDVNDRAVALTKENAQLNHVTVNVYHQDTILQEKTYDLIVTNPPIRIGKQPLYALLKEAINQLNPSGKLWLVMHKKHGALSAVAFLSDFAKTQIFKKDKGFHVIVCEKH